MPADVLNISIDTAEPRISTDRLGLIVSGLKNGIAQWNLYDSFNIYVDPVTYTAFLLPYCFTAEWDTTTTGVYHRQHKAETDKAASSAWTEHCPNNVVGNIYLMGQGTNDPVTSLASFDKNRGWYFSYFAFGQGETFLQLEITWGNVVADIYSDGTVQVFKNSLPVGGGNLNQLQGSSIGHTNGRAGTQKAQQTNVPVSFIILPCRHRELLFLSWRGGGFTVPFTDIAPDDPNPTILPAGKVTWQVPQGKPMVSYAPLTFFTSGYLRSYIQDLRSAPVIGAHATPTAYYDTPYYGNPTTVTPLCIETGSDSNFTGNGTKTQAKLKASLTGDGTNTPFVYGASAVFAAVKKNTNATHTQSLDAFSVDMQLSVGDNPSSTSMRVSCKNTDDLDALVAKSGTVGNRPIVAKIGSVAFLTGRTNAPHFEDGPNQGVRRRVWECRDRWKAFELYEILDAIPWDGRRLKDVITEIATLPGYSTSDMDIEDFDFTLNSSGEGSVGKWAVIPESGDTAAKWLLQLWQDYARTAIVGWYPSATGPKFRFRTPETIGYTPDCTLYLTRAAAEFAGYSQAEAHRHVVYTYAEDRFEPEANDIRVTGWDPIIDKAFQSHYEDTASEAPDTVPASRPDNWLGEPRRVAIFNPSITTAGGASYAMGVLRSRLTPVRRMAEITCEMQFRSDHAPVWRGGVIRIDTLGNFRVKTLSGQSTVEHASTGPGDIDSVVRPFRYCLEWESA